MLVLLFLLTTTVSSNNIKCDQNINTGSTFPQNENSCPDNSHCLDSGYCACKEGFIGGCTQPSFLLNPEEEVKAVVSNQTYTFFEVKGIVQEYNQITFKLCHLNGEGKVALINVWKDNGYTEYFNNSNTQPGGKNYTIKEGCMTLATPFIVFGSKINGQPIGFILGLKLLTNGQVNVSIEVNIQLLNIWRIIIRVFLILLSCFVIAFVFGMTYIFFKFRRRVPVNSSSTNQRRNIDHFEVFMPKIKMSQEQRENLSEQLCSVCLIELGEGWIRKTVCQHIFHQECLDEWCRSNLSCPICRKSFEEKQLKKEISFEETENENTIRESML